MACDLMVGWVIDLRLQCFVGGNEHLGLSTEVECQWMRSGMIGMESQCGHYSIASCRIVKVHK